MKLVHSPASDPRKGWRRTIRQARTEIRQILSDSPSLAREVRRIIEEETGRAVELAIRDMEDYDELSRLNLPSLRTASFSEEQVLGDWLPADQGGGK